MNKLIRLIKEDQAGKARYFREARQEIADKNLRLLKTLCPLVICLLLFFLAVTPLIIEGWRPMPQHLSFLPALLLLYGIVLLYQKKGSGSSGGVAALCLLFDAVLLAFAILIDVPAYPDAPGSFVPLLFIALPAVFILPFRFSYAPILLAGCIYVAAVLFYKEPAVSQRDIFNALVGLTLSPMMTQVITRLRVQDHAVRMKYQQLSTLDFLSGILNKQSFIKAAETYLQAQAPAACALLILDIDDFKDVNDKLGHYTGDVLLRSTGMLLTDIFRASDLIGRFGGDEFIVLLKGASDETALAEKCRLVQENLRCAAQKECALPITCSIGGVIMEKQPADFPTLFRQADDALYTAKNSGKGRFALRRYKPADTPAT